MQIIDIIVLAIIGYSTYKGFKNGLFVEIASIISYLIGIIMALKFSKFVAQALSNSLPWSPKTIAVVAFLLTFILVIFGVHYLAKLLSGLAEKISIGWLNKLGGAFFALIKISLIVGFLLQLFQKINYNDMVLSKEKQAQSMVFNPLINASLVLMPFVTSWANQLKEITKKTIDGQSNTSKITE